MGGGGGGWAELNITFQAYPIYTCPPKVQLVLQRYFCFCMKIVYMHVCVLQLFYGLKYAPSRVTLYSLYVSCCFVLSTEWEAGDEDVPEDPGVDR